MAQAQRAGAAYWIDHFGEATNHLDGLIELTHGILGASPI